ncbi:MAG: MCE family protein [Bacteroidales bacterium]|nr:MCE family protein [Bacteroidales bacterium]
MKNIFKKEFIIGLSVIVAIAILFFGIEYLKGVNLFKPANFYYASYENVAGLEVSAPITVDGFKVGQVREINFNYEKPGKIQVLLALDKNLRLPENSVASISSTLMSGSYIEIKLGDAKKMLEVGSELSTAAQSDLMASLSNDIMPTVNTILPRIDSLLLNLNLLVSDPALTASIRRLDGITDNVLLMTGGLNKSLNSQVPYILGRTGKVAGNLDSITCNLMQLSADLKALPLQGTMDNVNRITENLTDFSARLNNSNSTLGKLTEDPELYNRLNRVAADVDSLIVDIKKNPKRYISIKLL